MNEIWNSILSGGTAVSSTAPPGAASAEEVALAEEEEMVPSISWGVQDMASLSLLRKQVQQQRELLLAAGIHGQAGWGWGPDVPLAKFEGVTVDGEGLVVGLDFSEQKELEFDLAVFAPLTSLQVVNFHNCRKATGECSWNL